MNRILELVATPLLAVERFDHPGDDDHVDPTEEQASGFALNFIEGASFRIHACGSTWHATPGTIFCTAPGLTYRCEHPPGPPGDSCVTVSLRGRAFDDIRARGDWPTFRGAPVLAPNNRSAYAKERLLERLSGPAMALEAVLSELLDAVGGDSCSGRLYRTAQLSWYAHRIDRARERLDAEYDREHSLASLAAEAGMSPFHFARVFRELVGVPPHRYLVRHRLDAAAKLLRDGLSVTETCFASGFSNLSHFVRSFRARYGVSPSRFARREQ